MASSVEREGAREEVVSIELPALAGWKKKKVLARFEGFPVKNYSKLDAIATELHSLKIVSPMGQLLDKVERYFTKIKGEVDAMERTKDEEYVQEISESQYRFRLPYPYKNQRSNGRCFLKLHGVGSTGEKGSKGLREERTRTKK
ncbi:uncharacterized protein LOC132170224 [Corylus avellana]|uniref:uncharacterized protein LOC132170224 n=1 Tax=Corylus avellana TaxID=13451 RepID=UPI00286D1288|nr:uncharacterized protein LOC132170224 [Corylus avellana]